MSDLRNKLIRIAREHPRLRPGVLEVLRTAEDFTFISNSARTGFDAELLPQIARWVKSPDQVPAVADHLRQLLVTALREKNSLYLLLIRYKSLDASAEKYFDELRMAVDEWESGQTGQPEPLPPPPQVTSAPAPAPQPAAPAAPAAPVMPMMVPTPMPMMVPAPMPVPAAVPAPAPAPVTQVSVTTAGHDD